LGVVFVLGGDARLVTLGSGASEVVVGGGGVGAVLEGGFSQTIQVVVGEARGVSKLVGFGEFVPGAIVGVGFATAATVAARFAHPPGGIVFVFFPVTEFVNPGSDLSEFVVFGFGAGIVAQVVGGSIGVEDLDGAVEDIVEVGGGMSRLVGGAVSQSNSVVVGEGTGAIGIEGFNGATHFVVGVAGGVTSGVGFGEAIPSGVVGVGGDVA